MTASMITAPRWRRYLSPEGRETAPESLRLAATFATVAALHAAGFGLVAVAVAAGHGQLATFGAAMVAYLAGLRHAVDADHLCAIDNSTRKFLAEGRRPTSIGLAFSLGHSTVVAVTAFAVMAGVDTAKSLLSDTNSATSVLGTVGGLVAGGFLLLIGCANLVTLTRLRRNGANEQDSSVSGTVAGRLMTAPLRKVRRPAHIFLVGLAFSLGFDTAALIGLLVLTATTAATGLGWLFVAALPLCFAAGMTLGDSVNGVLMLRLYSRAADMHSRHRLNVAVTTMSVVSALTVASIVLISTARDRFGWTDPLSGYIAALDLEIVGYGLLALFATVWVASTVQRAIRGGRESL